MSDIDEIKSRLNITDIVGKRVQLKKAGRNFKGLCPFHSEKTPSFIVSPDRQTFHCFGCARGGSVFDFVMEYDHVSFAEALEDLAELAGVKLTHKPTDTPEAKLKQKLFEVNHLASEYYHYLLTKHALGEKGRLYLANRGISDKSVKTFTLGYSPNSWEGLYRFLRKKGYDDRLMESAGLVIKGQRGGYYDRFRGRIMFTLKDHRGNVVGFAGRVLNPDEKEAKYINTQETPIYVKSNLLYGLDITKDAIQKAGEAIVMEGELDVISSFQAGIGNAVAIKGSALTEGHVRLIRRFAERVIFALDSDMAGDAAARRGIEIADRAGLDLRVVTMPMGKDPDEAARENPVLLKKAIKDAVPIYDYFISSAIKRFDVTSAFGKRKMTDELLPIFHKIENSIVQGHYLKQIAQTLSLSEETLRDRMEKLARETPVPRAPTAESTDHMPARTRPEKLEVYLLAILLQGKTADLFEDLTEAEVAGAFTNPAVQKIIDALGGFLSGHGVFLIKDFADSLPVELLPTLDEAFLWDIADLLGDEELLLKEWMRAMKEFERMVLRRQISEFSQKSSAEGITGPESTHIQGALSLAMQKLKRLEKSS